MSELVLTSFSFLFIFVEKKKWYMQQLKKKQTKSGQDNFKTKWEWVLSCIKLNICTYKIGILLYIKQTNGKCGSNFYLVSPVV